jgi:hypothetical protein
MSIWLGQFLESLLFLSPYLLVDLVAVILALAWRRRHPRASLLTLLAIGLSVSVAIGGSFALAWLPEYLLPDPWERSGGFQQRMALVGVIAMIRNVLGAVAYALLIAAVFCDRSGKSRLQGPPTDSGDSTRTPSPAGITAKK